MNMGGAGRFFAPVVILSLPFYALGITEAPLPFAPALPISALMAIVPRQYSDRGAISYDEQFCLENFYILYNVLRSNVDVRCAAHFGYSCCGAFGSNNAKVV